MGHIFSHLQPELLLLWSAYGACLLICVVASLVASREGKHTIATVCATAVWLGAALPIALWSSSLPNGTMFINYPLAILSALGIAQAGVLLARMTRVISG